MPRARTSTKIKELSGNPGKRPINKREPKPRDPAKPPAIMSPMAKKVWLKLTNSMPEGVYTNADSHLLSAYCEAAAVHQHCVAVIAEGAPLMVKGSTGQEVINPIFKELTNQARAMVSIGQRLGLDPAARQSLSVEESQVDDDPMSQWLN